MKVKEIKVKREKLYQECNDLRKLEVLFREDMDLRREVEIQSGCDLSLDKLLTELRMNHYALLAEIDRKIDNAEIQE